MTRPFSSEKRYTPGASGMLPGAGRYVEGSAMVPFSLGASVQPPDVHPDGRPRRVFRRVVGLARRVGADTHGERARAAAAPGAGLRGLEDDVPLGDPVVAEVGGFGLGAAPRPHPAAEVLEVGGLALVRL